jgi:hypothetical protein
MDVLVQKIILIKLIGQKTHDLAFNQNEHVH